MTTETLAPDAVLASTNYTSLVVTDIDEDPDSPDANWGSWDGSGNTDARVSFPTPATNPTVGAGLQEFRVLIRKTGTGGNSTSWSLELWENGSQVSVLATGTTTSLSGEVVSGTWNASSLGTSDGSLVECALVQTAGGTEGGGAQWRGIEVGAVEWNATATMLGTASGAASPSGTLSATGDLAGTASGVASPSGALSATGTLAGTSSGVATLSGTLWASCDGQGDVPNAKDDTRFYSEDGGSGLSDLATDLSHRTTDMTVGTAGVFQSGAQSRWDVGSPAAWELDVDMDDTDTGYLYAYETGGNGVRLVLSSGGVIDAYVDNASVCQVTVPDIDAGGDNVIVSWSMEANPLTTAANNAVQSELRVFNVDDGSFAQDVAQHAEPTSVNTTAFWGEQDAAGTNAFTGTLNKLRFSYGRFHTATETNEDFVTLTSAPTLTMETRREFPCPPKSVGIGDDDQYAGPIYQAVAADLHQIDLVQAGHIWSELYRSPPTQDESVPTARTLADPDGDGFEMHGSYLIWRPVPSTCNRVLVRVHLQCWRTDANDPDNVVVRCYSMNRPPEGLANVADPEAPWERAYRSITRTLADGSGSTGGGWHTFDHVEVKRDSTGKGSWFVLAFDVQDAGGSPQTASQRYAVRAWTGEPGIEDPSGVLPEGGLG